MAFVLSRTSSPSPRDNTQIGTDNAPLPHVEAAGPSNLDHDMAREKETKSHVEIILDTPYLFLKGVGVDVEPTRLAGHVALYLTESTAIKEITLQFRGKAHLPVPTSETITLNTTPLTYIVCTHDWSFLEGEKKHSHTLKAGRHIFPFQLRIGGSLPSTISSPAFGGATIEYKLRAQAVKAGFGFHHSMQTMLPVPILRSFAPEAMEYLQTLEIENTWPEKLMYSIMMPHKAWAAGDKVTALVKLSPLIKGVCVLSVTTSIHEHTKVYARTGVQDQTRLVAATTHEISNGRAIETQGSHTGQPHSFSQPPSPASPASPPSEFTSAQRTHSTSSGLSRQYHTFTPLEQVSSVPALPEDGPSTATGSANDGISPEPDNADVVTYLSIHVPLTITPSHTLQPIVVSHRVRWSILLLNQDGHTSELRCSLPLHLLDYRLLAESRAFTAATRRLLLGGSEVPSEDEEEVQLPSYKSHVRDRVANMFLPESATMRVTNPWISQGTSPTHHPDAPPTSWPLTRSGHSTPLEAHMLPHLPHQPGSGASTPLDWVNSELLLSLSDHAPPPLRPSSPRPRHESGSDSEPLSRTHSRTASRTLSRFSSRTNSVERERERHTHPISQIPVGGPNETYMHGSNASRSLNSLFSASMKPSSAFSPNHWITRTASTQSQPQLSTDHDRPSRPRTVNVPPPDPTSGAELLHRAFTEVPDYAVASRGFIGGVPPLSSMQGLPSYDETQRSQSESDLTAHFARLSTVVPRPRARSPPLRHSPLST